MHPLLGQLRHPVFRIEDSQVENSAEKILLFAKLMHPVLERGYPISHVPVEMIRAVEQ